MFGCKTEAGDTSEINGLFKDEYRRGTRATGALAGRAGATPGSGSCERPQQEDNPHRLEERRTPPRPAAVSLSLSLLEDTKNMYSARVR